MNQRGVHLFRRALVGAAAVTAAVLLPISASAAPVPGDEFWSTNDSGTVLDVDPSTGAWTSVGAFSGPSAFRGMDVDPLTGLGFAIGDGEVGTILYSTDVTTGTQTALGPVGTSGGALFIGCGGLDLTAGVLTAVCNIDDDGVLSWFGTIDPASQAFVPLTELPAPSNALAVKDGIAYVIDENDDVWTLPATAAGIPVLAGTVTGTTESPDIIAADFDSAGKLWVVDSFVDPSYLSELDSTYTGVSSVVLEGPEGEHVYTGTLTITWSPPAPPEPGLPATGGSIVPESILLIVSLVAISLGAGVLVSRRPQED